MKTTEQMQQDLAHEQNNGLTASSNQSTADLLGNANGQNDLPNLPNDILKTMFSYLDLKNLAMVKRVSKNWQKNADDVTPETLKIYNQIRSKMSNQEPAPYHYLKFVTAKDEQGKDVVIPQPFFSVVEETDNSYHLIAAHVPYSKFSFKNLACVNAYIVIQKNAPELTVSLYGGNHKSKKYFKTLHKFMQEEEKMEFLQHVLQVEQNLNTLKLSQKIGAFIDNFAKHCLIPEFNYTEFSTNTDVPPAWQIVSGLERFLFNTLLTAVLFNNLEYYDRKLASSINKRLGIRLMDTFLFSDISSGFFKDDKIHIAHKAVIGVKNLVSAITILIPLIVLNTVIDLPLNFLMLGAGKIVQAAVAGVEKIAESNLFRRLTQAVKNSFSRRNGNYTRVSNESIVEQINASAPGIDSSTQVNDSINITLSNHNYVSNQSRYNPFNLLAYLGNKSARNEPALRTDNEQTLLLNLDASDNESTSSNEFVVSKF
ncbi:MAG: hypothetical protein Tsb005_21050 [Gammaproteobacteria bacterium]